MLSLTHTLSATLHPPPTLVKEASHQAMQPPPAHAPTRAPPTCSQPALDLSFHRAPTPAAKKMVADSYSVSLNNIYIVSNKYIIACTSLTQCQINIHIFFFFFAKMLHDPPIVFFFKTQVDEIMSAAGQPVSDSPMVIGDSSEEELPCGQVTPTRSPTHSDSDESCTPTGVMTDKYGNRLITPRPSINTPTGSPTGSPSTDIPSPRKYAYRYNFEKTPRREPERSVYLQQKAVEAAQAELAMTPPNRCRVGKSRSAPSSVFRTPACFRSPTWTTNLKTPPRGRKSPLTQIFTWMAGAGQVSIFKQKFFCRELFHTLKRWTPFKKTIHMS
jgi:hypothetical protein